MHYPKKNLRMFRVASGILGYGEILIPPSSLSCIAFVYVLLMGLALGSSL